MSGVISGAEGEPPVAGPIRSGSQREPTCDSGRRKKTGQFISIGFLSLFSSKSI